MIFSKTIRFILYTLFLNSALSAAEEGIEVRNISVEAQDDTVVVQADLHNLFSKKIIGMIDSGLPSILETELRIVVVSSEKTVWHTKHHKQIEYDLWGERYLVTADSVRTFPTFAEVSRDCQNLVMKTIDLKSLDMRSRHEVQIRVHLLPISSQQASKANGWLTNPSQTEETLPSDERSSGFSLNLNRLISFFVNQTKSSTSGWFASQPFSPPDLAP